MSPQLANSSSLAISSTFSFIERIFADGGYRDDKMARVVAYRGLEVGDRMRYDACRWFRGAAPVLDRRAHFGLEAAAGVWPGTSTLRVNHYRLRPSRHDPHHAQTARRKCLT